MSETDRQTERQTDSQPDRQTDSQTETVRKTGPNHRDRTLQKPSWVKDSR